MWYQSPLIGPMGLGPPELQSITAAQFLVPPGFGPTGMVVLEGSSPQPTSIYNGFSLYSHSYTPHFSPPQYYPPPPQLISQFPQFHTQMTTMADSNHSVSQVHSPTPHTHNQSYPSHPLYHQLPSNSPESLSQPFVHSVPRKTTITPPICLSVSLSQHNPPLGCVKLEEVLNAHTPSLTEMRLEPNFIVDGSPKEKLKSVRVKGKFKVISRIMMKRERLLGFSRRKQFQLSAILNSFLELSIHGDNFASGASLGKSNPSDDVTTEVKQDLGLSTTKSISAHQSKLLHETSEVWHRGQHSKSEIALASHPCVEACFQLEEQEDHGWVDDKLVGLPPGYGQLHKLSNVNSEFNACKLFDKRSQLEGLFSERMIADEVVDRLLSKVLTSLFVNSHEWYLDDKIEKLTKNVETVFEGFKSAIPDHSYNNLFVTFGCLHKDQLHKLSNEESEFNALQLFDKRLQLEGLYSEGRIGDAMFGWLLESVIVPAGDMNSIGASMNFFLEVFPSLLYTYHNWRAILNWFLAAVIHCSVDPYVFIDNILLGGIGGRESLHFGFKMERKTRNVEKMFDVIWHRWKSQIISGTLIIEIFVKELNVKFFGNYMQLAWIRLDIHHTSLFRNGLLLLTTPAKDIHVLQEFKEFHFYWVPKVIQSALFLYLNLQEFVSFYLLHQELIYGGLQLTECQLEIPSNVTYGITVRYKRLLQYLSQRLLALICGPLSLNQTIQSNLFSIEIFFAEFSKTSELGMVIHTRELLTTRRYQAIVSLQLGYSLMKGLLFSCIAVVGKVSHMSLQLGYKKLDDNIGWKYWQKQVDHHGSDVIGNSRDQFNNANCDVKLVGVIHIFNQRSSCSLEVIVFLKTAFELSHWRYEIITWFLLLKLCMWLRQSLQFIIHNETTSTTLLWFLMVNCDSRFLVVNCGSLSEQRHNYLKITCDLEGMIDWKWCQGYQVAVGIVAFGLHNFSITKHLQQCGSLKIIQRKFSLEVFQVYNSNFGKVPADSSYFLWPFVLVTTHPFEENALTVALQSNEQLINIKTELSDGMHMTKYGNKMLDYEISIVIDINYSIPVVVIGLISVITIWFATVAYLVQTATLLVEGDNMLGRHELSNKGSQQVVESFLKKSIVRWVQWIGATAWKMQKRLWLQLGTSFICSGKELLGSPFPIGLFVTLPGPTLDLLNSFGYKVSTSCVTRVYHAVILSYIA